MTESSHLDSSLARLSFWVPAERRDDFAEAYDRQLSPLLKECGLENPFSSDRPPVPGVFSLLFAVESASQIPVKTRALRLDAAWQKTLHDLQSRFDPTASEEILRHRLELYSAPAGPGRATSIGPGLCQGLWQTFGITDGMPSCISAMLQDHHGDLWLGTGWLKAGMEWGVCRYDGAQLLAYTTADGLTNDRVRALLEDRQGRLWFGTFGGGLSCYDGTRFENYTTADGLANDIVLCLLEDQAGYLWIGTLNELSRFDGQRFETFTTRHGLVETYYNTDGLPSIGVSSLLQDQHGQVWVGTWGGVNRWDGQRFETFTTRHGLANNWVRCLLEDRQGQLWVGTGIWDSGSGKMEQKGGVSRWDGSRFETFTTADGLASGMVRCLLEDRQDRLWIGTWGGGVSRWDGQRFETFTTQHGLANDQVFSLLEDRGGSLWLGTVGGGLSRYDQAQVTLFSTAHGLPSNGVGCLLEDCQGQLWVGTREGMARYDGTRFISLEELSGKIVNVIAEDRQGKLWIGTNGDGIMRYDGRELSTPLAADHLSHVVSDLLEDRHGHIWAATNRGVSRYDGSEWTSFTETDGLVHHETRALLEDRQGHLWCATDGGVSCFDGRAWTSFTVEDGLAHDNVMVILEDRDGHLWFGTDGGGMSRYDGKNFETFTVADGLAHDQIYSMLQDRNGHIWVGTYGGGVNRYDGQVFQRLIQRDGLAHNAVNQLLQDRRGDIWIATGGGLTRYRPQHYPPNIHLTEVIADRHYDASEAINLPESQQVLLFRFQGASLTTRSDGMAYLHRLEGHASTWKVAYEGQAEYPRLPVGDYTFQVKAVDRDLNYSTAAQIQITVEPDLRLEGWKEALGTQDPTSEFVGTSPALRQVQTRLAQVAPTDVTVLILGDTGTGKGLAARMLHQLSDRRKRPFFAVNCGSLPAGLVESELFGHEKGAFTGATRRKLGKVELAEGGTLFLDEIGDLPREAQVKLLHFLEERTFERVGGTRTLTADVRVVTATNRDLPEMVAEGSFRKDLYFRLQVFKVELPRLRERREDIPQLAHYFMERMAAHLGKEVDRLTPEALERLRSYAWPGNVRELEHAIQRAVIVCPGSAIRAEDIALEQSHTEKPAAPELLSLEEVERRHIRSVLEHTGWVISGAQGAAAVLGLHEATLRYRMKKLGIKRPPS